MQQTKKKQNKFPEVNQIKKIKHKQKTAWPQFQGFCIISLLTS